MSLRDELICELRKFASEPQNSFDKIIGANAEKIDMLSTQRLSDIYTLRKKSASLCKLIPYSREDIALLVEAGEVDPTKKIAQLENNFSVIESIFNEISDNNS
jgi:hypothetical protein